MLMIIDWGRGEWQSPEYSKLTYCWSRAGMLFTCRCRCKARIYI